MLLQQQGVFSQNENDFGQTKLLDHTINTSDAKPIKQPPHFLLITFADKDIKALAKLQVQRVI